MTLKLPKVDVNAITSLDEAKKIISHLLVRQARLGQPDGGAQGQHGLAKGIVVFTVGGSLHARAPFLPRDPPAPSQKWEVMGSAHGMRNEFYLRSRTGVRASFMALRFAEGSESTSSRQTEGKLS